MIRNQRGATLIIVLVLLVAITVIGSLAIRSSVLSLKVSTLSQAQQLLLQNSDAALFKIEDPDQLMKNMALNGMFGYIKGESNVGRELVFCFKSANANFFSLSNSSLISWNGSSIKNDGLGNTGFCKMESGFFTSGRSAVITQIAVKAMDAKDAVAFQHMQKGTDPESSKKDPAQMYTIYATSIFPNLSSPTDMKDSELKTAVNTCFNSRFNSIPSEKQNELSLDIANEDTKSKDPAASDEDKKASEEAKKKLELAAVTVSECLSKLGVPTHTQVANYALTQTLSK
ncbi:pilus assembly protein PilX [Acinetobacter cumulans]|uniref:pilus assembly PilX family protein n=1 Tax=Acinetobacter cumulans TaxID=2136182 RepID=UPI000EA1880E|nr:pilus assembly PilX N-terminal domain-containing protein [Acinetobacter cumulans]RKG51415.1 pilus assembly protein PilX [Acinetobacter cumulans]